MKATIELEASEAKALLSLVSSDGKGMAPKRLSEALRKKLEKSLSESASSAEPPVPLESAKHTPMMRKKVTKREESW